MGNTEIGKGCMFDPNVMIFEHNHNYKYEEEILSGNPNIHHSISRITVANC